MLLKNKFLTDEEAEEVSICPRKAFIAESNISQGG
jgi:hypothetical protein